MCFAVFTVIPSIFCLLITRSQSVNATPTAVPELLCRQPLQVLLHINRTHSDSDDRSHCLCFKLILFNSRKQFEFTRNFLRLHFHTVLTTGGFIMSWHKIFRSLLVRIHILNYQYMSWTISTSWTISPCPKLWVRILHYQSMFWTISPCPVLSVHVLNYQSMSCTINPCSTLSIHVLHYQSNFCTINPISALSVHVLYYQFMTLYYQFMTLYYQFMTLYYQLSCHSLSLSLSSLNLWPPCSASALETNDNRSGNEFFVYN